jgi:hypothetical protein
MLNLLRRKPFVPFRVRVSDGRVYEIRHPELAMVGLAVPIIGLPTDRSQPDLFGRSEIVDLRHVVRLEPLTEASSSSGTVQS